MGPQVLLYWPNIIGYIRIGLLFAAWTTYRIPAAFIPLYSISIALDGVDGWLARRLGQSSRFGAWLDVVVDNLSRGMLWSLLFENGAPSLQQSSRDLENLCQGALKLFWWLMVAQHLTETLNWGWLVSAVEWCVFVCNHNARGSQWKSSFTTSPRFVQAVMANGFRTPLGTWVMSGIHCLPLWLYAYQWGLLSHCLHLPLWIQAPGTLVLATGRLLGLSVEIWCIWTHIEYLTSDEPEKRS